MSTERIEQPHDKFLVHFYQNQYEQRWRGSRTQDWILVSAAATLSAAVCLLQMRLLPTADCGLTIGLSVLPILIVVFGEIGFRVLLMHQQVMNHAVHIAKGVEAHFNVVEERRKPEYRDRTHDLYVGVIETEGDSMFVYPSKGKYVQEKPLNYADFQRSAMGSLNVQSAITSIYRVLQGVALVVFLVNCHLVTMRC